VSRGGAFITFWRKLLLGDDWRLTAATVLALALTALLQQRGLGAWWLLPPTIVLTLAASVRRVTRATPSRQHSDQSDVPSQ
jgi:hypothetical protein